MGKAQSAPDDGPICLYGGKNAIFEVHLIYVSRILPFPEAPLLLYRCTNRLYHTAI